MRKQIIRAFFLSMICVLIVLTGACSASTTKSISLSKARTQYTYNQPIMTMLQLASDVKQFCVSEYGITVPENLLQFLPGTADALAWQLTAINQLSLKPVFERIYYSKSDAIKKKDELEKQEKAVWLAPVNPLTLGGKPAPLLETWAQWNYERITERVMQVIFYYQFVKALKRADSEELTRFLAEKATEEFLRKKLNPASPVLARYISEQRDARTFESLFPDFVERINNLYTNKDPALDTDAIQKTRTMLMNTWLANYRQNYANRFLTNIYAQFGNSLPSDAELAAYSYKFKNWKKYMDLFTQAQEKVSQMLILLKNTR